MRERYEVVIGLEVHVQLTTNTKIFCGCSTAYGSRPNSNTCPVCLGMPGSLPVLNRQVVEDAIQAGLATHCTIAPRSIFARKNYFYPDLPSGYQISQLELPICEGGYLDIETPERGKRRIGITRIHMEADAGKLLHSDDPGVGSLVDLNRASTPLLEVVSEPDMRSSDEAIAYLKQLHQIVRYLNICSGNMEEGAFRCDANVSVRPVGQQTLGTRAELKNINSFRFIKEGIEYEVERQIELIEEGGAVVQETRLFDSTTGTTRSMRGKEEAHDYRYFPDPDLVPMVIDAAWIERVKEQQPELPAEKMQRFMEQFELPEAVAQVLTAERPLAAYFEACTRLHPDARTCANWVMGDVQRMLNETGLEVDKIPVSAQMLCGILVRIADNTISGKLGKQVFDLMWESGKSADTIIAEQGLKQVSDTGAIEAMVDEVICANPAQAQEFRAGKDKLLGFFVGQVMKASRGKANPAMVNELLCKKLRDE
ncbi:MAG: Asp-tRNA(Asn)/Glu-tRNA(Gln) amidotransferase subunit GatB [Desulfuromonas sp.]